MGSSKSKHELLVTTRMKDLVSKDLRKLGKTGKTTGAMIAGGFIAAQVALGGLKIMVRGVTNFVKGLTIDVANQGDEFAKMALRIGASVEALSEYKHVAEISGVAFNTLTMAWQRQTRRIAEAAKDTGEAKDAIRELGLSAIELNKLAPDQQFERLADALAMVENKADRVRLAMKLWDSEGVRLVQVVNQGSAAIRAMKQDAHNLGLVYTGEMAKASEEFNDALLRTKGSITGVKMAIGQELLPVLTGAFDEITTAIVENKDEIGAWATGIKDDVIPALKGAVEWTQGLIHNIEGITFALKNSTLLGFFATLRDLDTGEGTVGIRGKHPRMTRQPLTYEERDTLRGMRAPPPDLMSEAELAGHYPPTPYPDFPEAAALAPEVTEITEALAGLNTELLDTPQLMVDWGTATEETDATLQDFAQNGLSATQGAFSGFFDSMLRGTADTAGAVRNMVSDIISSLARMAANQAVMQIIGVIAGAFAGGATRTATPMPTSNWELAGYAAGGPVPGPIGSPQLAIVHGGEEVLTPRQQMSRGSTSITINQTIHPAPGMSEEALAELAAASVARKLRESRGFRSTLRGYAKGGLY